MEHLVIQLKESLMQRKQQELDRVSKLNKEENRDLLLISSGKIFELDVILKSLTELINYYESTKKIKA
jgi:hypothetical protein